MIAIQHFNSRLTIWTFIWNTCTLAIAQVKEAAQSAVLFISIVTNSRYKSLLIVYSQNSSNVSKLETRALKLEPWNSILDSRKHRVLRFEFRVETVNLHLTGSVFHKQSETEQKSTHKKAARTAKSARIMSCVLYFFDERHEWKLIIMLHPVFLLALLSLSDTPGKRFECCRVPCVCYSETTPHFSFNYYSVISPFSCIGECSRCIFFAIFL